MRRFACPILLVLAAACGGSSPTTTTPGAPASVAIVSGDGQSGAPGSALPVKLSVLVKDANGLAVPNVTVQFAVDSGGGSLDVAAAVTGSTGATGGVAWTLGPVATTNMVSATVGTIAPVRFFATAQSVILDQTQSTAGGTLTVSSPGNAVDGLQIVVPPSSFATPIHWQVSSRPATDLPARPGLNPISPLITIHTGVGTYSDSGIVVRIPAQITPGRFAMAFYYDRAIGTVEALPLVRSDANSVTIMTRHFSAAALLPAGGGSTGLRAALHGSGIPAVGEVEIVVSQIDPAELDADISSPFRPATDGWEINNPSGWAISAGGHCAGWSMTAIWYYYTQRMAIGALFNRYSIDPAIWEDNVRGWRWADLAWGDVNWENYAKVLFPALVAQYNPTPALPATLALNEQRALAYALKVTGMPQYVGLTDALGAGHAVAAYRVANNRVYYADPAQPGVEVSAAFDANFPASGATWKYQMMAGVSSFVPFDKIAARWQTFQSGTIGNAEYPAMLIERAEVNGTDTSWMTVADTMWSPDQAARLRVRCPSCPPFAGGLGDASRSFRQSNAGVTFATAVPIPFTRDADFKPVFGATPPFHEEYSVTVSGAVGHLGMAVTGIRSAANQGGWGMVDFRQITMIYNQATILPAAPAATLGAPLSLTVQVAQNLLPPQVNYVWDFGDQQPTVTVANNPAVQHTYAALGSYPIKVKVIDIRNSQVVARAIATATITATPIWRFTSLTLTGESGPNPVTHLISPSYDADGPALANVKTNMARITAIPSDGLLLYFNQYYRDNLGVWPFSRSYDQVWLQIAQTPGAGATVTRWLGQFVGTGGNFEIADQCAPPRTTLQCGADNLAYTGTTSNATLVGLGGRASWGVSPPIILGDWSWWQISANVNGNTLSGSLTYTQQMVADPPNNFLGPHVITWTFTATRVP